MCGFFPILLLLIILIILPLYLREVACTFATIRKAEKGLYERSLLTDIIREGTKRTTQTLRAENNKEVV